MLIGIITARKGSKRIKNKNIRILRKKPIYCWAIKILKKSQLFNKIVVTTDHPLIFNNAKKFGADLVLYRKKELTGDKVTTIKVIKETIDELNSLKFKFKYVCCMYPTGILSTLNDIKKCFLISKKNKNKFIFPVYPIKKCIRSGSKNIKIYYEKFYKIKSISENNKKIINQLFVDAGQYYFSTKENWKKKKRIISKNNIVLIKKNTELRDINTLRDLKYARKIFKNNYEILQ